MIDRILSPDRRREANAPEISPAHGSHQGRRVPARKEQASLDGEGQGNLREHSAETQRVLGRLRSNR